MFSGCRIYCRSCFGETWIPSSVFRELTTQATPIRVREFLGSPPKWLRIRDPRPEPLFAIDAGRDAGERAALALACEMNAMLILVDDEAARKEARPLKIRVTGTIGVLRLVFGQWLG